MNVLKICFTNLYKYSDELDFFIDRQLFLALRKYDWKFSKNAVFEIVESGHHRDRWFEISNFKMPVLLVRGENSHVLKQQTYEKMLAVNPNITGLEIAGAGTPGPWRYRRLWP